MVANAHVPCLPRYLQVGHGLYMNKINSMVAANSRRLLVDLNHLRDFDAELAKQ